MVVRSFKIICPSLKRNLEKAQELSPDALAAFPLYLVVVVVENKTSP